MQVVLRVYGRGAVAVWLSCNAGSTASSYVVDHSVRIDTNTDFLATLHHILESILITRAACQLPGNGLVARPPSITRDVLIRRGNLDSGEALGPKPLLALLRNVDPRPLEEVDEC